MRHALFVFTLTLFQSASLSLAASSDLITCKGDGFHVILTGLGKLRLIENGKTCELDEAKVSDHRRSTFSHIQLIGIKRACPGFENWMQLIDLKINLDDRKSGQVIGRIKPFKKNGEASDLTPPEVGAASDLTPPCRLEPVDSKKLDLFFLSSKRG